MYFVECNREINFQNNSFQKETEKMSVASISPRVLQELQTKFSLINAKREGNISKEEFSMVDEEVSLYVREQERARTRVKELDQKNQSKGFALVSLLMILGLLAVILITSATINNLLY